MNVQSRGTPGSFLLANSFLVHQSKWIQCRVYLRPAAHTERLTRTSAVMVIVIGICAQWLGAMCKRRKREKKLHRRWKEGERSKWRGEDSKLAAKISQKALDEQGRPTTAAAATTAWAMHSSKRCDRSDSHSNEHTHKVSSFLFVCATLDDIWR